MWRLGIRGYVWVYFVNMVFFIVILLVGGDYVFCWEMGFVVVFFKKFGGLNFR